MGRGPKSAWAETDESLGVQGRAWAVMQVYEQEVHGQGHQQIGTVLLCPILWITNKTLSKTQLNDFVRSHAW